MWLLPILSYYQTSIRAIFIRHIYFVVSCRVICDNENGFDNVTLTRNLLIQVLSDRCAPKANQRDGQQSQFFFQISIIYTSDSYKKGSLGQNVSNSCIRILGQIYRTYLIKALIVRQLFSLQS